MCGAALVTGATGGLGRRTALTLARQGRDIIVAGRRREAVQRVCEEVRACGVAAHSFVADFSRLGEVNTAIDNVMDLPLHAIVGNAGITTERDAHTENGVELTFAVNVLAHQLIYRRLGPRIADGGRIVVLSSGVHLPDNKLARRAGVPVPRWVGAQHLADQRNAPSEFRLSGRERYSTSKLANVLQARGLQQWFVGWRQRVDVFALDPGLMVDTNLARELPALLKPVFRGIGRVLTPFVDNMRLSSVSAGHVASLVHEERWRGEGFAYLDGASVRPPSKEALRDDLAKELWETCENLLAGLPQN